MDDVRALDDGILLNKLARGEKDEVAWMLGGAQGLGIDVDEEQSAKCRPENEPGLAVDIDEEVGIDRVEPDVVDAADEVAFTMSIVYRGLCLNGKLCRHEEEFIRMTEAQSCQQSVR